MNMHVEPPGHAPQSLKDFGVHYLMIVVGILTAVGIEQGIEAIHHRELASQAVRQIEEELQGNLHEASSTLAENRRRLAALKATEEALTTDVSQRDMSAATFMTRVRSIAIGAATPALRRDAWDAAIASQALTYVDPTSVRRYSGAYSAQRDTTATILATFAMGNWPGQLESAVVDAKLGRVDQVGLLKALAAYELALAATAENERELEEALHEAAKTRSSPASEGR
jgi:hypothetical protein